MKTTRTTPKMQELKSNTDQKQAELQSGFATTPLQFLAIISF